MPTWTMDELKRIAEATELDLESERSDGSLREPVTMWVVRVGGGIYVRSVKGRTGPWFRGVQAQRQGRISSGGVRKDVTFTDANPADWPSVGAAYHAKYDAYRGIVDRVLTEQARESTLKLLPR
ncbi:DUF2255 family protein [Streptomyces sp. NBC_01361]|uniref:DUF2255 family protein n=1 Tax=Streptomyces sp. NBC_01361 TaxID=2903838 RepID=UPI002E34AAB2|nr:DUF2255 family protein [Streptomyces sp. NBC_01361]